MMVYYFFDRPHALQSSYSQDLVNIDLKPSLVANDKIFVAKTLFR